MTSTDVTLEELEAAIRNVPDFPQEGIQFKDITPVLGNARLLDGSISHLLGDHTAEMVDVVAGIDARGFIFGAAMARRKNGAAVRTKSIDVNMSASESAVSALRGSS